MALKKVSSNQRKASFIGGGREWRITWKAQVTRGRDVVVPDGLDGGRHEQLVGRKLFLEVARCCQTGHQFRKLKDRGIGNGNGFKREQA